MADFTCAHCGGTFAKGWSDEDAAEEAKTAFGVPVEEWRSPGLLVCDDCYKKMLPADHPDLVEESQKHL